MSQTKEKILLQIIRKNKAPGTVAIFEQGSSYKCYEEDAVLVANSILLSDVGLKRIPNGEEEILCLTLNALQYMRAVKELLLIHRLRVEVYEENFGNYSIKAKGILGNLDDFEDIFSNSWDLNAVSMIMSVKFAPNILTGENCLYLSFCNAQEMRIIVAKDDTDCFSLFEQCVSAFNPSECIILESDVNTSQTKFKRFETAIRRSNLQQTLVRDSGSDFVKCQCDIERLLKEGQDVPSGVERSKSLHLLLDHMQLLSDPKYNGTFSISDYESIGYLHMSNQTYQSLDIFSTGSEFDSNRSCCTATTLFGFLNRCRSQPGKRTLHKWMRQPLCNLRLINERLSPFYDLQQKYGNQLRSFLFLDVVEVLMKQSTVRQKLHDLLRSVPDILFLIRRLTQKKSSLQDCYCLYQLIKILDVFLRILNEFENEDEYIRSLMLSVNELILEPLQHSSGELERFLVAIETFVDLQGCDRVKKYRIKPSIDQELTEFDEKLSEIDLMAKQELSAFAKKLNCESIKLETTQEGYHFKVTAKVEQSIRDKITVIKTTKGDGVHFRSAKLEQLNDEYRHYQSCYDEKQKSLTDMLVNTCVTYIPAFHRLADNLGILDVLVSFATVSVSSSASYVRPVLLEKGSNVFELSDCRHALVENSPNVQYIPNDVSLGLGRFIVLTGANMGGKSTYLKAAALVVYMAQIGCFVPCTSARFSLVDGIFTRVGAGDFQFKGISTFMAEMMDCASILQSATESSLILIDELGRGTSTFDGFGLAWAIAEEIITKIRCACLFATHFHELSALRDRYSGIVENFKVDTIVNEDDTLTILYQVARGVADRSFGLNIAKVVGFPQEIIDCAANILEELETNEFRV